MDDREYQDPDVEEIGTIDCLTELVEALSTMQRVIRSFTGWDSRVRWWTDDSGIWFKQENGPDRYEFFSSDTGKSWRILLNGETVDRPFP